MCLPQSAILILPLVVPGGFRPVSIGIQLRRPSVKMRIAVPQWCYFIRLRARSMPIFGLNRRFVALACGFWRVNMAAHMECAP
jgi:hypothetical protein